MRNPIVLLFRRHNIHTSEIPLRREGSPAVELL